MRWEGGRYGIAALTELSRSSHSYTRLAASDALRRKVRHQPLAPAPEFLAQRITVYPRGARLPESFLKQDWNQKLVRRAPSECMAAMSRQCDAILRDMDGDGTEEILMFAAGGSTVSVFRFHEAGWSLGATFQAPCPGMLDALRSQKLTVTPPASRWNDVIVDGQRLTLTNSDGPDFSRACPKRPAAD